MKLERGSHKKIWQTRVVNKPARKIETRQETGRAGEDLVAAYVEGLGYQIVARNWYCRGGELDLVLRRGVELVVVEVRTRRGRCGDRVLWSGPEQTVRYRKQKSVVYAARCWLAGPGAHWCVPGWSLRFDVVGVCLPGGELCHLEGAFTGV